MSPTDKALAKMLLAWDEWPAFDGASGSPESEAIKAIGRELVKLGLAAYGRGTVTDKGRDLLDRARKAGVL